MAIPSVELGERNEPFNTRDRIQYTWTFLSLFDQPYFFSFLIALLISSFIRMHASYFTRFILANKFNDLIMRVMTQGRLGKLAQATIT